MFFSHPPCEEVVKFENWKKKKEGEKTYLSKHEKFAFPQPPMIFFFDFLHSLHARVTEKKGRVPAWGKQEAEEARPQARIM